MKSLFEQAPDWVNFHYQTVIGSVYWLENAPSLPGIWSGKSQQIKPSGFGMYKTKLIKREQSK